VSKDLEESGRGLFSGNIPAITGLFLI